MGDVQKRDRFASMIKLCRPTPTQERRLMFCPFTREHEFFDDSIPNSLDPIHPKPTPILMLSVPDTSKPAEEEDGAVYVTPPEHHLRSFSSDEEEIIDIADLRDRIDKFNGVRVFKEGLGDEAESKEIRVSQENDTVPLGETGPVDGEIEGNGSLGDVIVLDSSDSDEVTVNLGDQSIELSKIKGKGVVVNESEEHCQKSRDSKGGLGSNKIEVEIARLKCVQTRDKSVVDNANVSTYVLNGAAGSGSSGKGRFDEIDKYLYNGSGVGVGVGEKRRRVEECKGGGDVCSRRRLPASMQETKGSVVKRKGELVDLVKVLELFGRDAADYGSEDLDFLETARRRGLRFPRPRWWLPDGCDA